MSQWRRGENASSARQTRSSAMVGGLTPPRTVTPPPPVPAWLVEQQKAHVRTGSEAPTQPKKKTSAPPAPKEPEPVEKPQAEDDDFIMVDLLDGAHLPTKSPPVADRLTSNSDSIISLPPIDERMGSRWHQLKQEAQEARRSRRGGRSLGPGTLPGYLKEARLPRAPISTVDEKEEMGQGEKPKAAITIPGGGVAVENIRESMVRRTGCRRDLQQEEIVPLLGEGHASRRLPRKSGESFSIPRDVFMDDDGLSTGDSSMASRSTKSTKRTKKARRRKREEDSDDDDFRPSAWGWRMPAEEDAVMPTGAWVYLPLIGWLTFMIAISVNSVSAAIARGGINRLAKSMGPSFGKYGDMLVTGGLRGLVLAASFIFVLFVSPQYSAGSGIPEMKCVLSGVLMPRMLNWKTLVAKMVGLTLSLASSISIGSLGPFIHMSGITAALVSKLTWFRTLQSSARYQLQALSAAMAAGVGATFGAPIGGTMLSIEVMSTYYYIHWLPMALYCSIMGYFFVVSLVQVEVHSFFPAEVHVQMDLESSQRLVTYVILGALCGVVGAGLVQLTKCAFLLRRSYFTNATPIRTTAMLFAFAVLHTVIATSFGGILNLEQKEGVTRLFNARHAMEPWLNDAWRLFQYAHWNSAATLALAMVVKFVLTAFSLVLPVPAGTFMPIFEIGALLGRAFGELCSGFAFVNWVDPRATAIIGAASLTAGALHTTSIAVVMLELTREAIDVLPLAVGVIVSYGVSKQLCSDLFSELIKIRRLPFILGLRERYPSENKRFYEDVASIMAGSFMSTDFPFVTPNSTKEEVYAMLTAGGKPWINCALLSDNESRRLWGTVSQKSLWDAIGDDYHSTHSHSDEELGYGSLGRGTDGERISFLKDFDPSVGSPLVDMGPMQVSFHTPFWKIITLFRMLSMSTMYVVKDGVTVGCVSKAQVISQSFDMEDRAKRRRSAKRVAAAKRKKELDERTRQQRKDPAAFSRLASRLSEAELTRCGRHSRQNSMSQSRR